MSNQAPECDALLGISADSPDIEGCRNPASIRLDLQSTHRIFHSLQDLGIHTGVVARTLCYGGAGVVTLLTIWSLSPLG
jgi:hypothetical protein